MPTAEGCRARRERLWRSLDPAPDLIVLHDPQHLVYFAGYYASPFVYNAQNGGAMLVLTPDRRCLLVTDNLQHGFAERAFVDERKIATWYDGRHTSQLRRDTLVLATLEALAAFDYIAIGVEPEVPYSLVEGLRAARVGVQPTDVAPAIHRLRRHKDPDEVDAIRRCLAAATTALDAAQRETRPGMTELQVFELVQAAAVEAVGAPAMVYGDFAAGPHSERGGGGPTDRPIEANDLVLLDFSVVIEGYRGDFANTFVVADGTPTPRQRELAGYCRQAMAAGEALLRAGTPCRQVDSAVRAAFDARGVGRWFHHHSGHGLGLGHPDPPYIVAESTDTLLEGDVVTLEPGLYVPGEGGMRFERDYLITADGFELLSHHPIGLEPRR